MRIRSRDKDISASRQKDFLKKMQNQQTVSFESGTAKLVFDFGLLLQQCMAHYAGLLCAVSVKSLRKKVRSQNAQ